MQIDLDESFGFLIAEIGRLLRERFNLTAQAVGLTLAQARALVRLARDEGISQAALAQRLEIQPITLLRQLDRLAEAGLVERRPNPTDRRAQQLYLTEQARALLEEISALASGLTDAALDGITAAEQAAMIRVLKRVRANVAGLATGAGADTGT